MNTHNIESKKHNLIQKIYLKLGSLIKFIFDSRYRSEHISLKNFSGSQHQQSTRTKLDRYPRLFEICSEYFSGHEKPKLLSFGCSTGEEVFSIGQYLPIAKIIGVDINEWCVNQCSIKYNNPNFSFLHSLSDEFEGQNDFDAIFCLAVLQDTERNKALTVTERNYTFNSFEETVTSLDKKLTTGGLLIIDNTDFNLLDTEVGQKYTPLETENNQSIRKRPLFDKNNNKVSDEQNLYRVFVKK